MPKQRLTAFYYLGVKGATRKDMVFYAIDVDAADLYARRWCRKRGYKCYRKKGKHH